MRQRRALVGAAHVASVTKSAKQYFAVIYNLAIDSDAAACASSCEKGFEDACGVSVVASYDWLAANIYHRLAYYGVEAEIAYIQCVAVVYLHYVDVLGFSFHKLLEVEEHLPAAIVFHIVVAAA